MVRYVGFDYPYTKCLTLKYIKKSKMIKHPLCLRENGFPQDHISLFILAILCSMRDLNSWTRDRTSAPGIGNMES